MKLTEALKYLITEAASYQTVSDAIKGRQVLVIYYDGDEPGGKGMRVIEPVCLGETKAGNMALRAWDYEGASHTAYIGKQPLPGWRLFRLDKIISLTLAGYVFNEPRPGYNFSGDKSLTKIYINAKFDGVKPPEGEVEAQPQAQPEAPKQPTTSWINKIKDKFTNFFSKFKK